MISLPLWITRLENEPRMIWHRRISSFSGKVSVSKSGVIKAPIFLFGKTSVATSRPRIYTSFDWIRIQ